MTPLLLRSHSAALRSSAARAHGLTRVLLLDRAAMALRLAEAIERMTLTTSPTGA